MDDKIRTIKDIYNYYQQDLLWLKEICGIDYETRFDKLLITLKDLSSKFEEDGLHLVEEIDKRTIFYSGQEAKTFINICESLGRIDRSHFPQRKCREMFKGPLFPDEEKEHDGECIHGRNYQFEFELMAFLEKNGLRIRDFEDVTVEFQDITISLQCKRPRKILGVRSALKGACDQLVKRNLVHSHNYGVVAVSLELAYNHDKTFFHGGKISDVYGKLKEYHDELDRQCNFSTLSNMNQRIFGVIYVFRFMYWNKTNNELNPGFIIYTSPTKETLKHIRNKKLFDDFILAISNNELSDTYL